MWTITESKSSLINCPNACWNDGALFGKRTKYWRLILRLKPPVSTEEALAWLKTQAVSTWGVEDTPDLDVLLTAMAESMAAVSAANIPEEIEPLLL